MDDGEVLSITYIKEDAEHTILVSEDRIGVNGKAYLILGSSYWNLIWNTFFGKEIPE